MTFNELLIKKPWDKWNMEKHGKSNSSMLIYHWSWLELLQQSQGYVRDAYKNSVYQKGLQEFIEKELSDSIYKGDRYPEEKKEELRKLI